mgnify:CR=1 FL=1
MKQRQEMDDHHRPNRLSFHLNPVKEIRMDIRRKGEYIVNDDGVFSDNFVVRFHVMWKMKKLIKYLEEKIII